MEGLRRILPTMAEADRRWSSVVAGIGVGLLATIANGNTGLPTSLWLLLLGTAWLGVSIRRMVCVVYLWVGLTLAWLSVGVRLAVPPPSLCDFGWCHQFSDLEALIVAGSFLAPAAYLVGRIVRWIWSRASTVSSRGGAVVGAPGAIGGDWHQPRGRWSEIPTLPAEPDAAPASDAVSEAVPASEAVPRRSLVLLVSWAAILIFVASLLVTRPVSASDSFAFNLSPEWHVRVSEYFPGDGYGPQVCSDFLATLGDTFTFSDPGEATICVAVYWATDGRGAASLDEACFRAMPEYAFFPQVMVERPPIPGAVEQLTGTTSHFYNLSVARERWVGPVRERLCYWITVTEQRVTPEIDAAVNAALATFELR